MTNKNEVDAYESKINKNRRRSDLQEEQNVIDKNRQVVHKEKLTDFHIRIKGTVYEIDEIHSDLTYKNEVNECAPTKIRIELI